MATDHIRQNSPYFQTVKYLPHQSAIVQGPMCGLQRCYFFHSNFVIIVYVFKYFVKLHPNKHVAKK